MDALEGFNIELNLSRKALDIARASSYEFTETTLNKTEHRLVDFIASFLVFVGLSNIGNGGPGKTLSDGSMVEGCVLGGRGCWVILVNGNCGRHCGERRER